jgi:hypothetical protein
MVSLLVIALSLTSTACQMTQSPFQRTAGEVGATFAAASVTLTYEHQQKISQAYATSSFENYLSNLQGLDQDLPSQSGTPDPQTVQQLLSLYKTALEAVKQPCLEEGCDWRGQVASLDKTSQTFLKAGGQ